MQTQNKKIQDILNYYREISYLQKINSVLDYDLNVSMPSKGSESRASHAAYIEELIVSKWKNPNFREMIQDAQTLELNEFEKAIVRNIERQGKMYWRVPEQILINLKKETSIAFVKWSEAKSKSDFSIFVDSLEKIINLVIEMADHIGYTSNRYDALLDQYEPGLNFEMFNDIAKKLRTFLSDFVAKIVNSKNYTDINSGFDTEVYYDIQDQKKLSEFIAYKLGYDYEAGRLDVSAHPFTSNLHRTDVRITTRYDLRDFRESLTSTIHEVGHALYEQGINPEFDDTPLEGGVSLGIHESQSRFYENQVGRSKYFIEYIREFLGLLFPSVRKINNEQLYRFFNQVKPSFIRTEADEVTYNLHIILRFEIEELLINKKIKVKDLPEIWNDKMQELLGIRPQNDKEGVLQDVHWSYGYIGYFPTYSLGNLYSAQIAHKMKEELDIEYLISRGEFIEILNWLRKNIHIHGSLYYPNELINRVTSEDLNPDYFIKYIREKYTEIYHL